MELRGEICEWIARNRERYAPFVDDERGLDVHLGCMRRPGESSFFFFWFIFLMVGFEFGLDGLDGLKARMAVTLNSRHSRI